MTLTSWQNNIISNNPQAVKELLAKSKTIAVIAMTDATYKPSYYVPKYMLDQGYEIIPINPKLKQIEGIDCFTSLSQISKPIDIVQVFRRAEDVLPHAQEALEIKPRAFWLQTGIINLAAAKLLAQKSILVVMDRCMYVDHKSFFAKA
ncbi:MAG: succinyl-CoA synthase subunit beta [bacterium]|nr:MAG: succinyl-CoA synthase subunit beta [bacterium]